MRYRCLVLDHDDTAVDSTPQIHYPAYLAMMSELRPARQPLSLEGFFRVNFDPGYFTHMREDLGMTENEIRREIAIWREYVARRTPRFFPGVLDVLRRHRARGGWVAVVSHSEEEVIRRDYGAADQGPLPDIVWGWSDDPTRRKPSAFPLERILEKLDLSPEDALVVDDLLPGITMAHNLGVDAVAAGWAHAIPEIRQAIHRAGVPCLQEVRELSAYLEEGESE